MEDDEVLQAAAQRVIYGTSLIRPFDLREGSGRLLVRVALRGVPGQPQRTPKEVVAGLERLDLAIHRLAGHSAHVNSPWAWAWVGEIAAELVATLLRTPDRSGEGAVTGVNPPPPPIPSASSPYAQLEAAGASAILTTLIVRISELSWTSAASGGHPAATPPSAPVRVRLGELTAHGTVVETLHTLHLLRRPDDFPAERLAAIDLALFTAVGVSVALLGIDVKGATSSALSSLSLAGGRLFGRQKDKDRQQLARLATTALTSALGANPDTGSETNLTRLNRADPQATAVLVANWAALAEGSATPGVAALTGGIQDDRTRVSGSARHASPTLDLARSIIYGDTRPSVPQLWAAGPVILVRVALLGGHNVQTSTPPGAVVLGVRRLRSAIERMVDADRAAGVVSGWVAEVAAEIATTLLPSTGPVGGSPYARLEEAMAEEALDRLIATMSQLYWQARSEDANPAWLANQPRHPLPLGKLTVHGTAEQILLALHYLRQPVGFPGLRRGEVDPGILAVAGITLAVLGLDIGTSTGKTLQGLVAAAEILHGTPGGGAQPERMRTAAEVLAAALQTRLPGYAGTITELLRQVDRQGTARLLVTWDRLSGGALREAVDALNPPGDANPTPEMRNAWVLLRLPFPTTAPPDGVDLVHISAATLAIHTAASLRTEADPSRTDRIVGLVKRLAQAVGFVQRALADPTDPTRMENWMRELRTTWAAQMDVAPSTGGPTVAGVLGHPDVARQLARASLLGFLTTLRPAPGDKEPPSPGGGREGIL